MEHISEFPFASSDKPHPQRRFVVVRRVDGHFSVVEEYYYRSADEDGHVYAEGWAQLPAFGLYASSELAEIEVRALIAARP